MIRHDWTGYVRAVKARSVEVWSGQVGRVR